MHISCYKRFQWFISNYKDYLQIIAEGEMVKILDVGGHQWNGSVDDILNECSPHQLDVLDICDGNGVTIIPRDPYCWAEIPDESYHFIYSLNTFAHIEYFWLTIKEMQRITKKGGIVLIITPSMRYDGCYPYACWAINKDGLAALSKWSGLTMINASVAGVPDMNCDDAWDFPLDDAMLIALKGTSVHYDFPKLNYQRRFVSPSDQKASLIKRIEMIIKKDPNKIKYWIEKHKGRISFYGAGDLCYKLLSYISKESIGVIVYENKPTMIEFEIKKMEWVCKNDKNIPIIITVSTNYLLPEIKRELKRCGFTDIYYLRDFLCDLEKQS
uniref:Methyltransferase family protein n=1 Tax=Eubacterium cellulosolvens (strain ATCC 43171 / JCM 9499 / 6) TaxID=633697 RepID=I5AW51_EUBC6